MCCFSYELEHVVYGFEDGLFVVLKDASRSVQDPGAHMFGYLAIRAVHAMVGPVVPRTVVDVQFVFINETNVANKLFLNIVWCLSISRLPG